MSITRTGQNRHTSQQKKAASKKKTAIKKKAEVVAKKAKEAVGPPAARIRAAGDKFVKEGLPQPVKSGFNALRSALRNPEAAAKAPLLSERLDDAGDAQFIEFDVEAKLTKDAKMTGPDGKPVSIGSGGGKAKAGATLTMERREDGDFDLSLKRTVTLTAVGDRKRKGTQPTQESKLGGEIGLRASVTETYTSSPENVEDRAIDLTRDRVGDSYRLHPQGGQLIDQALNPSASERAALQQDWSKTKVEAGGFARLQMSTKYGKAFGVESTIRDDWVQSAAVEVNKDGDVTLSLKLDNDVSLKNGVFAKGGIEGKLQELSDVEGSETTLNLKWEGAAAGKDPLEIAQQVLGGQWESPDSVTLKNKVQEHDFFEQGGAKVTFDGTHAPYTETTTQVTFDTRDAERHELAALFKGDKAQAKKFNPEASQTVERFSFEGPDFDIKPEIKIPKVAKGMDLSIGVELESGIQRRDALIEKTLDPGEAVDQIRSNIAEPLLSPLPVTLGGPNSTPELAEVASTKPLLGPGSSGADVAEAQEFLKDQGYGLGEADGIYGPATSAAVERFQSDHGLASDGVLGKETWTKLLQGAHGGSPSAGAPERGLPAPVVGSEDGARLGVPDLPGPDGLQEAAETVAKVVVGAPLLAGQKLSEGVSSEWNKLSDAEKAYVQENPRLAGAFKWAKESTDRVSVEMGFEKNNSDKGIYGDQGGNAYRHALWNALMVKNAFNQDFRPLTSRQDKLADAAHEAKAMADAHEDNPKNTDVLNMEMDFHNNDIGRQVAIEVLQKDPSASEADIAHAIEAALDEGRLVGVYGGGLAPATDPR